MKSFVVVIGIVAGLAPGLALAKGNCHRDDQQAALSCAQGTVWDAESQRCVTVDS